MFQQQQRKDLMEKFVDVYVYITNDDKTLFFFFFTLPNVSASFLFYRRAGRKSEKKITKASATEFTKSNYDITFITSSYV